MNEEAPVSVKLPRLVLHTKSGMHIIQGLYQTPEHVPMWLQDDMGRTIATLEKTCPTHVIYREVQ